MHYRPQHTILRNGLICKANRELLWYIRKKAQPPTIPQQTIQWTNNGVQIEFVDAKHLDHGFHSMFIFYVTSFLQSKVIFDTTLSNQFSSMNMGTAKHKWQTLTDSSIACTRMIYIDAKPSKQVVFKINAQKKRKVIIQKYKFQS